MTNENTSLISRTEKNTNHKKVFDKPCFSIDDYRKRMLPKEFFE
ncbi:MAG: hypothetical protein ACTSYB_00855 [Candidatus Helarchaeota archaeon]